MGKCKYCGQSAGFLSSKHKDCELKNISGKNEIVELLENCFQSETDFSSIKNKIETITTESYVSEQDLNSLYTSAFDNAVIKFLDDGILTIEEESKISDYKDQLNLPQEILDKNDSFQKVVRASVLRDLTEGNIPEPKISLQGHLPFNFQKTEKLIWVFAGVQFYEQTTRTQYQGGYSGVSIRVAKGVYYKTGEFKGNPVKIQEMKFIGTGLFALTNKHVYFSCPTKNLRLPLNKIITMDPYEDGIGLQKDGVTAKPQVFKNLDGWFTYNAMSNLT